MKLVLFTCVMSLLLLPASLVYSACLTPNNSKISAHFPNYPFWRPVAAAMKQCGNVVISYDFDAVSLSTDSTSVSDTNLGQLVGVSNASLYRLQKMNLLRPLDDLVEKYKSKLNSRQLVSLGGKTMAIAVVANAPNLVVHKGLLEQEGIEIPKTYFELIVAANKLKDSKAYSHPLSLAYKSGWNLTQAFFDLHLSQGALPLDNDNMPLISSKEGVDTLVLMKRISQILPKDYLEADPAKVLDDLLKFKTPMAVLWASSVGPLDNPAVSRVVGKMDVMPPPSAVEDRLPAGTLWWDGFAIPASASDEEADAAFRVALEGLDEEMLARNRDIAAWLLSGYTPGRLAKGVITSIDDKMPVYPASEAFDLLHRTMAPHIEAFMLGKKDAAAALNDAESDYLSAAKENGIAGL